MKRLYILFFLFVVINSPGLMYSCKKENVVVYPPPPPPPPNNPIDTSYTVDFGNSYNPNIDGWYTGEYTEDGMWNASGWYTGIFGTQKADTIWYGFEAHSFQFSQGEYIYSYSPAVDYARSFNRWLLTPVLKVKNGDSISFYTRGDTTGIYTNRMQVLLNKLGSANVGADMNSTGDFNTVLYDINPSQSPGGYPTSWTKYSYIFSGITGKMSIRIGFRHFAVHPTNARGVGIDDFHFGVK